MKYDFVSDSCCPPESDLDRVSSSSVELTHFSLWADSVWCKWWQESKRFGSVWMWTLRLTGPVDKPAAAAAAAAADRLYFKLSSVMPNNYFIFVLLGNHRFKLCNVTGVHHVVGQLHSQSLNRYSFQCVSASSKAEIFLLRSVYLFFKFPPKGINSC